MFHRRKIVRNVLELIGGTPIISLNKIVEPNSARILAKLESFNPGGSVKDRIALSMVEDAEKKGVLKPGGVILEPTSGNTGIGLAMVAAVKGYRLILVMPSTVSAERIAILKAYGAEVVLSPGQEGMPGAIKEAEKILAQTPGVFMPQQFKNPANPQVHRLTTAQEIIKAVAGRIDVFVCGVGTGGTLTGVGGVLKKRYPKIKIIAVEPAKSAVLSGKPAGPHKIQGIGAGFIPDVLDKKLIDEIITVEDEDAFSTAQLLARKEGIFAGFSSGAACWAALKVAAGLGKGNTVVTVFPDTGERYLSMHSYFTKA